jgi:RNA polymerase sigma-70 factor (ECF subfamily)
MQSELHTTALCDLLERFQGGDPLAVEELFRRAGDRLERLARAMLKRFPLVRQREQTDDVLQEALLSLLGALRQVRFSSTREFYALAAEHIRRRLLDLHRRHSGPHRDHAPLARAAGGSDLIPAPEQDSELDGWQALHEAVAGLPVEQREVFSLRLYHGWTVEEIAALLQVSTRTVDRLWLRAHVCLRQQLGGRPLPGEDEPVGE